MSRNMTLKMCLSMEHERASVYWAEVLLRLHVVEFVAMIFKVFWGTKGSITPLYVANVRLPGVVYICVVL